MDANGRGQEAAAVAARKPFDFWPAIWLLKHRERREKRRTAADLRAPLTKSR